MLTIFFDIREFFCVVGLNFHIASGVDSTVINEES